MQFYRDQVVSPLGLLIAVWVEPGMLCALDYDGSERLTKLCHRYHDIELSDLSQRTLPKAIGHALIRYFEGDFTCLTEVAVWRGGSSLEQAVWSELRRIPPGETLSYGQVAARIGRPTACRAVGRVNASNPVSIVVPCHRVVGAGGDLRGYSGGIARKAWLLAHETSQVNERPPLPLGAATSSPQRSYSHPPVKSALS
jgi:methylated-DNA-[protein]-cysteine S-methyltransferase